MIELLVYDPRPDLGWRTPGTARDEMYDYSMRLGFFSASPGARAALTGLIAVKIAGIWPERKETLASEYLKFVGIENDKLHYFREYKSKPPSGKDTEYLDKNFTEDTWFQKSRGLVRLEQKVEGVPSMTWRLVDFEPPGVPRRQATKPPD